jgi:erythromycin esterase
MGLAAALCASVLVGCGSTAVQADTSLCQTDLSALAVPQNVQIIGLGEASHGVSEYQKLKAEVFQALAEHNGCRTFVIEGDFGGSLKVEQYIHGGPGTAQEAVGEIGFAIYRTQEMAALADWMRSYNEAAPEGQDLHFYGMDMQRYDNNKEYLFSVLDQAAPALSAQYQQAFAPLTDDARPTLASAVLQQGQTDAQALLDAMDAQQAEITAAVGAQAFAFARECANSILECCELTASGSNYNSLRDGHMQEKVDWILQHGDGTPIFLTGHNGHIGKVSAAGYPCLGSLLAAEYGDAYFAIGTDAADTRFQSQTDTGFTVRQIKNKNAFTAQLDEISSNFYYLDFDAAAADANWQSILAKPQRLSGINVGISAWQQYFSFFYTQTLVPADTYDGMIVFQSVSPSTLAA